MRNRGFSVIELVGVVALLGVLGLAALVKVPSSTDTVQLDAASKQVQSDILYARQLAMATGVPHGVTFVATSDYLLHDYSGTHYDYVVFRGPFTSPVSSPIISPITRQRMVVILSERKPKMCDPTQYPGVYPNPYPFECNQKLYPGIILQTSYDVVFDSFGAPTLGGDSYVVLSNVPGSMSRIVKVIAETGRVVIQ